VVRQRTCTSDLCSRNGSGQHDGKGQPFRKKVRNPHRRLFNPAVFSESRHACIHSGACRSSRIIFHPSRREGYIKDIRPVSGHSSLSGRRKEKWYYTLLMSTGLTFGTISALYGLANNIISQAQYSFIVGSVIASVVIPTIIANKFFLPAHLLEEPLLDDQAPDEKDIANKL